MKPHYDNPSECPNAVEVTSWLDRHPRYMCGCHPNVVRVKGYYNEKSQRWFYTAVCDTCGHYGSNVSASLFSLIIDRADKHARHGDYKGWKVNAN